MPEYALTRNYLDLMVELPWTRSTEGERRSRGTGGRPPLVPLCFTVLYPPDRLDIGAARQLLDSDHYALDKLKRRVLEYLAVRQLKASLKVRWLG